MAEKTTPTPLHPAQAHPGEALETVLRGLLLTDPVIAGPDGRLHVALPKDFGLTMLPDDTHLPPWPHQKVTVDDRASFSAYANRFADPRSLIIADYDALKITARLDWHPNNSAESHGTAAPDRHAVTLALRPSEEFTRWNTMEAGPQRKLHDQETFARFIEENSVDIGFPDAATMLEISRDLEATVGQTYKSSVRLQNGDRSMRFESESNVTSNITIPDKFTVTIPIYNGEAPTDLIARFRWQAAGGGRLLMGFEWHRVEYLRRAHFALIATTAAEETGLPMIMGRTAA